jgi:methylenetetrahydrofolate--tRNA-(uracil-5-)-methyltransferase
MAGRRGRRARRAARDAPRARHRGAQTGDCAELVCSNSFRSDDAETNAVGLLHEEMRRAGSLIMATADRHALPAGGALAVDREPFARAVTQALEAHPNIELRRGETGLAARRLGVS